MSKPVHLMNARKASNAVSGSGLQQSKTNPSVSNIKKTSSRKGRQKGLHPLEKVLGEKLIKANRETISPKALAGQDGVIGLYFAAHWCPPCRSFSPQLAELHDELKTAEKKFDVIFISFDTSEESFTTYFSKMPWFAIDYKEQEKREEVAMNFGIKGIPVLLLLDTETYEVITLNGRDIVVRDPKGEYFPWKILIEEAQKEKAKKSQISLLTQRRSSLVPGFENGRDQPHGKDRTSSMHQSQGASRAASMHQPRGTSRASFMDQFRGTDKASMNQLDKQQSRQNTVKPSQHGIAKQQSVVQEIKTHLPAPAEQDEESNDKTRASHESHSPSRHGSSKNKMPEEGKAETK